MSAILKLLFALLLALSALQQLLHHQTWWFIQNVNLIFHEAGHLIFGIFGSFIGLIGGSLMEILVPTIATIHFYLQRHYASAAFGVWWLSTACLSVSIYASDAQERLLPLLGGDAVLHDWFHILLQLNLLQHDDLVGYFFWLAGLLCVGLLVFCINKDTGVRTVFHRNTLS